MIDPALKPFLETWERVWSRLPVDASAADRRATLERFSREEWIPLPSGIVSEERYVSVGSRAVRIRIYKPVSAAVTPCLLYMHGGGWIQGSPETHEMITAAIAAKNHQTVISIDYALAPEHPFPAAVEDCAMVVRRAFAEPTSFGIEPDRITVGGDSAGGNLAAAMTLLFRGSEQKLKGQMLFYPPVDFDFARPSFVENADGPIIVTSGMQATAERYLPNKPDWTNPLAAPYRAASHSGLPPAFIAVAEHDPLRDDGYAYAQKLKAAGVPVEFHAGIGLFHGYLRALAYGNSPRRALDAACDWLAKINDGTIAKAA